MRLTKDWKIFASKTFQLEKKFLPLIVRAIKRFRSSFINDLTTQGINTAQNNLQLQMMDDALSRLITRIYKDAGLTGAKLQNTITPLRLEQKAGFGKNEEWIKLVQDYLQRHMFDFISNITETMRADILKVIEQGVENGWGIAEIVKELRSSGLITSRAKVIARTEINRASNVGHSIAAQQLPYEVDKRWVSALDHRTRHSHKLINNHVVDEDDTFRVAIYKGDKPTGQYDQMQFPGDPNASPSNTINCRCRVIYIPKRDSNGRLILRRANTAQIIPIGSRRTQVSESQIAAALKANIRIGVDVE